MAELLQQAFPSLEVQILERFRCTRDPVYYLNTYGYVYNDVKNIVDRMQCFKYQERCVKKFNKYQKNIILKSRQTGISAVSAGYAAWKLMFNPGEKILIISNEAVNAEKFLKVVKEFIEHTPKWLQPDAIIKSNTRNIEFSNGSSMQARASSPNAGRGEAITLLILDEAAFIKDINDIWKAAALTISKTKGKCIIISTPKGTGNLYHKLWVGAINRETDENGVESSNNGFNPIRVHWTENPMCSERLEIRKDKNTGKDVYWSPWYEEQCKTFSYDPISIAQELDLSFEGSKYLAIDPDLIRDYEKTVGDGKAVKYIKYDFIFKGEDTAGSFVDTETKFLVWKMPEPDRSYVLAADVARGDSKDYSTIQIFDAVTLEQVAEYRDKIGPDLFPFIINWAGKIYNNAFIACEANSFGLGVNYDLRDKFKYKRLHYCKSVQAMHVRPYDYEIAVGQEIPGFQTNRQNRPLLVKTIIGYMRENTLILHSLRLMAEMQTFIINGDRPEAERGYNDDLIMALGIALYVRSTEYNNVISSEKSIRSMLDAISFGTASFYKNLPNTQHIESRKKEETKELKDVPPGAGGIFINKGTGIQDKEEEDDNDLNWLYQPIKK